MQRISRFGVLGDIHGEDVRLTRALDRFDSMHLDAILSVGDIADGPGDVARCVRLLRERGVVGVRGNHDRWLVRNEMRMLPAATLPAELDADTLTFLSSLPATRIFDTPLGSLLLMHGIGKDDMARLRPDDGASDLQWLDALPPLLDRASRGELAVAVGGHTHVRMVRRIGAYRGPRPMPSRSTDATFWVQFSTHRNGGIEEIVLPVATHVLPAGQEPASPSQARRWQTKSPARAMQE